MRHVRRLRSALVHQFVNRGLVDSCFVSLATPGVFGPDYFLEIRDMLAASASGPPDDALIAVVRRHGLTPAAPIPAS